MDGPFTEVGGLVILCEIAAGTLVASIMTGIRTAIRIVINLQ